MARWLVKTEPEEYSFQDLQEAGRDVWDGVRNALALKHMRAMNVGDEVLVYHTGKERAIVGVARVVREAYPILRQATSDGSSSIWRRCGRWPGRSL